MNKIIHVLNKMTYDDLQEVRQELVAGKVRTYIDRRLEKIEQRGMKSCPVCGGQVDISKKEHLALDFGSPDFRKRAHFDAIDCLEYFLARIKDQKRGIRE